MFDLLDLIWKLLSQIIIGVRIIRWFELMDELRYVVYVSDYNICVISDPELCIRVLGSPGVLSGKYLIMFFPVLS